MNEILKILAERISRKAILLMTGMILVYMIVITASVANAVIAIGAICGLSVLGVLLQFILDLRKNPDKIKKDKKDTEKDT